MAVIGTVESLWRYPVKSMRGEALDTAYLGFAGLYGDRVYAFGSDAAVKGFPYLTGREQRKMLLYRPRFRHPEKAAMPPDLTEAESLAPGLSPLYGQADDLAVEVEPPSGETLAIDDPVLMQKLNEQIGREHGLTLLRSDRAMTDCRPVSLCSLATVGQLGEELGTELDKRRFRANTRLPAISQRPQEGRDALCPSQEDHEARPAAIAGAERSPRRVPPRRQRPEPPETC